MKKNKNNKKSLFRGFCVTLVLGIVLIITAIISNQFPDEVNNMIETNLNIPTNSSNVVAINTVDHTSVSSESKLQIYFFDVGQGDSELLIADGQTMLIDGGNDEDGALLTSYIHGLGIEKIDYLIGTHPQEENIGGLDDIINNFEIGKIYMPDVRTNTAPFQSVLDALSAKGLSITSCEPGDKFGLGDGIATIMAVENEETSDLEDNSIVIHFRYGAKSFLFMADAGKSIEEKFEWPDVDVLKIAKHGSDSATTDKFINQVKPEIAIISVGKNSNNNTPSKSVLDLLKKIGAKIYRTDIDGTILLITDGKNYNVETLLTAVDGNSTTSDKEIQITN